MKLPWPAAGPEVLYTRDRSDLDHSHLVRGEVFAHRWLDQNGYQYDVAGDYDLQREPELLAGRKVLVINGHSEYWSAAAYRAVDRFLEAGGSAIVMSGNLMFWRVSSDEDGTAMECRKHGADIDGRGRAHIGEIFHSHDQRRGSLTRYCGLPVWKVLDSDYFGRWEPRDHGVFGELIYWERPQGSRVLHTGCIAAG